MAREPNVAYQRPGEKLNCMGGVLGGKRLPGYLLSVHEFTLVGVLCDSVKFVGLHVPRLLVYLVVAMCS